MKTKLLCMAMFAIILSGCSDSYESQSARVDKFFSKNKIGSGVDYFLVKQSFAGPERVAVIYGFMSDSEFCNEVAALYMTKYPRDRYFCEAANR